MTVSINGTSGLVFNDATTQATAPKVGMVNRIINGAMVISQRGTSFAGLTNGGNKYTLDRWLWAESATSTAVQTVSQDSSAPVGFVNSLKVQTTTAQSSLSAGNAYRLIQYIEGNNVSDLGFGTANAKTFTLSFWVRSSLTGTFGGSLFNQTSNRFYVYSYSINSADTWEYKTITIAGDTSGTWDTGNTSGLAVQFSLGAGSDYLAAAGSWGGTRAEAPIGQVNVAGTLNATLYITGVQLEKGSTATSFDYRPYGTELQLCQRYYCKTYNISVVAGAVDSNGAIGGAGTGNTNRPIVNWAYPVQMRATPTITIYSPATGTSGKARDDNTGTDLNAVAYITGTAGTRWYPSANPASGNDIFAHLVASVEL
jgi:ribosomal protein L27